MGNYAYVCIRGTINNWDMLTDAQLWSAAALMQILREMLPLGDMWTPSKFVKGFADVGAVNMI